MQSQKPVEPSPITIPSRPLLHMYIQSRTTSSTNTNNAWVKELMYLDSLVAGVSAILCAMELATIERFGKVTIKSDAKVCIDELVSSEDSNNWKISALIGQSLALVSRFSFCDF
jgi:hypothetical protein